MVVIVMLLQMISTWGHRATAVFLEKDRNGFPDHHLAFAIYAFCLRDY
jgi:hypothetical protein